MVELAFVTPPEQNWFFRELVATLRDELALLGIQSVRSDNGFPEPRSNLVYVIIPPHEFVALEGSDALGTDPAVLDRTIFVCAEQPLSVHFAPNVELSRRAGAVFDINAEAVRQFRLRGVLAEQLALGYTRRWDHYVPDGERDIDVLFMGCSTQRRTRYLASYARQLSRLTCHFQLSDNAVPNYEHSASFLTTDKWELLARSKLLINLHQAEEPYFEWLRALDAIHCGCVLLSEHSTGYAPFEPGRHFFSASPESIGLLAEGLVANEELRSETASSAYDLIRERRPMSRAVGRLVAVASRLAERPVPARAPVRPTIRPVVRRPDSPRAVTLDPDASMIRRALKDSRLDALELRRSLANVNATVESPTRKPPPRVRRVAASSAWIGGAAPRVSVVTALYNHAAEIVEGLDSVARSSYSGYEIVVVNDGSTDGSGAAVTDWIGSHDHVACLLLQHPVNQGLGAARNTAIEFARGEYCFVLDADNEIYPRCLETLVARLDADPAAAFAYPILEVFQHVEVYAATDGDHLLSRFAWDPAWLRGRNFIDALALIRTSVLRDLGGYAMDRRLYGLEDYDLWCRIADRGLGGSHVAQVLARYRASPSSMLSLAGISLTSAYTALAERSPSLMAGLIPPM